MIKAGQIKVTCLAALTILLPACTSLEDKARRAFSLDAEAKEAYREGRCDQAIISYQKLSEVLPKNTESLLRIGNCHVRNKQPDLAISSYQAAISRDPSYVKAWYNLSYLRAKELGFTVAKMSENIDPSDPSMASIRQMAEEVLAVFDQDEKEKKLSLNLNPEAEQHTSLIIDNSLEKGQVIPDVKNP